MSNTIQGGVPTTASTTSTTATDQAPEGMSQEEVLRLINSIDTGRFRTSGAGSVDPSGTNNYGQDSFKSLETLGARISAGDNGELTSREQQALQRQQFNVGNVIGRALADGKITAAEQKNIDRMLANLEKSIDRYASNTVKVKPQAGPVFTGDTTGEGSLKRLQDLEDRITAGLQSGKLTDREGLSLRSQQMNIGRYIQRALSDGQISANEQRVIDSMQNRFDSIIDRAENNSLVKK